MLIDQNALTGTSLGGVGGDHRQGDRVRAFGRVWDFDGRSGEICQIDWKGTVA